jgi:hypothetical protein
LLRCRRPIPSKQRASSSARSRNWASRAR